MSSFASGRSSSTYASSKPFQRKPFGSGRQAFVAERPDEEELIADEQEAEEADPPNLEEVLQAEAEILATEIEEAGEEGVESALLQDVEETVESAGRSIADDERSTTKAGRSQEGPRLWQSWSIDDRCKVQRLVPRRLQASTPALTVVSLDIGLAIRSAASLERALGGKVRQRRRRPSRSSRPSTPNIWLSVNLPLQKSPMKLLLFHVFLVATGRLVKFWSLHQPLHVKFMQLAILSCDKRLAGALDSACNRTVAGPQWLISYLEALREAPGEIWSLVDSTPEREVFRFSDGGTQVSTERWRLPMVIGNTLMVFWTSVVPVPSLGLLLGRDFLESVGATMSFSKRVIKFDFLGTAAIPLKQLAAGHFLLRLIPRQWPGVGSQKWRKLGTDHVIELQVTLRGLVD